MRMVSNNMCKHVCVCVLLVHSLNFVGNFTGSTEMVNSLNDMCVFKVLRAVRAPKPGTL